MHIDRRATQNAWDYIILQQNVGKLPFKDAKLAKGVGLRVEDFEDLDINPVAVNIVYDALAHSKNSMLPPDEIMNRRSSWLDEAGGLNELSFRIALYRARFTVTCSWFIRERARAASNPA